jgi:hypothetical protein
MQYRTKQIQAKDENKKDTYQRIDHIRITTKLILQILGETNHVPLGRVYIR